MDVFKSILGGWYLQHFRDDLNQLTKTGYTNLKPQDWENLPKMRWIEETLNQPQNVVRCRNLSSPQNRKKFKA